MQFLTFVRLEGDTVVFESDEGGERSFQIRTGREGLMHIAHFDYPERFSWAVTQSVGFSNPHYAISLVSTREAVNNLLERCRNHGSVAYNDPGTDL